MNKYQKYLMELSRSYITYVLKGKETPCFANEKITITQDEDITITKYALNISNKSIDNAFAILNGKEEKLVESIDPVYSSTKSGKQKRFSIELDFEKRIEYLKIVFVDNIADDLIIPIVYAEANKEQYYAKKEKEHKDGLLKKADIKVSTGADLVNIYFQPCSEDYARTEIILYKNDRMLAKYKVDEEVFFKSINSLAYGKYEFVLKQIDKSNSILFETSKIDFRIAPPFFGRGKPTIFN